MNFQHRDLSSAIAARERGDYTRAVQGFQAALQADPEDALAHAHYALCLINMNKQFAASREADLALAANADLPICHLVRAMSDAILDDEASAQVSLNEALRLDPENVMALKLRCAIALGNRDLKALSDASRILLSVAPEDDEAHYFAARLASKQMNAERAERHAREALRLDPQASQNHVAIGWAFWVRKEFGTAKEAALSALSLDPDDSGSHELLAAIDMHRSPLTGWFNRLGYVLDNLNLKTAAMYGIPMCFAYMIADDLLKFFGHEAVATALLRSIQVTALLLFVSTQVFARKATAHRQAARLKTDY